METKDIAELIHGLIVFMHCHQRKTGSRKSILLEPLIVSSTFKLLSTFPIKMPIAYIPFTKNNVIEVISVKKDEKIRFHTLNYTKNIIEMKTYKQKLRKEDKSP